VLAARALDTLDSPGPPESVSADTAVEG